MHMIELFMKNKWSFNIITTIHFLFLHFKIIPINSTKKVNPAIEVAIIAKVLFSRIWT